MNTPQSSKSGQTWSRPMLSVLALGLAGVVFIAVNVFVGEGFRNARIDLTQDRAHTISQGTLNTLAKIKDPIKLRLYFSDHIAVNVPRLLAYGQHVKDILAEYKARAGANLIIEIIQPQPFSAEEDSAAQAGLKGVPSEGGETFYFGIVGTNQTTGREVIPYLALDRENFIEYDLTRLIANLNRAQKPVVGVMTDLPLSFGPGGMMAAMRGQSKPYVIYDELGKQFEIKVVPTTSATIDPSVKVLLLAHPSNLSPETLFAIDQFVLGGGRLIALVDPFSEIALTSGRGPGGEQAAESSTLKPLFEKWGVELVDDKFVADRRSAQQVMFVDKGQQRQMGYLAWLHLTEENLDRGDVATAQFKAINMGSVGALKATKDAKTKFTSLIFSSSDANLVPKEKIASSPDPVALNREFQPSGERYTIAARISGDVETAFPNGAPKSNDADAKAQKPDGAKSDATKKVSKPGDAATSLKASTTPINVVVIADTDFLDDKFWVQTADLFGQRIPVPNADNASFLAGLVDNLSGSGDLIGLRARPPVARPFTRVDDMRKRAEERFLSEEKRLQDQLAETEKRLAELSIQGKATDPAQALSAAQLEEVAKFQKQRAETRLELRAVQRKLREDIDRLDMVLKFINIAFVPALLAIFAIGLSIYQARRRASRLARLKVADARA
jgi:ABC-type uncharacterized transport system involved in gliding motility auxiliary subunit